MLHTDGEIAEEERRGCVLSSAGLYQGSLARSGRAESSSSVHQKRPACMLGVLYWEAELHCWLAIDVLSNMSEGSSASSSSSCSYRFLCAFRSPFAVVVNSRYIDSNIFVVGLKLTVICSRRPDIRVSFDGDRICIVTNISHLSCFLHHLRAFHFSPVWSAFGHIRRRCRFVKGIFSFDFLGWVFLHVCDMLRLLRRVD